jgi:hypothetical protein
MEIKFSVDSAAFEACPELEIIRILKEIEERVAYGQTSGAIMDINGNKVGEWSL